MSRLYRICSYILKQQTKVLSRVISSQFIDILLLSLNIVSFVNRDSNDNKLNTIFTIVTSLSKIECFIKMLSRLLAFVVNKSAI